MYFVQIIKINCVKINDFNMIIDKHKYLFIKVYTNILRKFYQIIWFMYRKAYYIIEKIKIFEFEISLAIINRNW